MGGKKRERESERKDDNDKWAMAEGEKNVGLKSFSHKRKSRMNKNVNFYVFHIQIAFHSLSFFLYLTHTLFHIYMQKMYKMSPFSQKSKWIIANLFLLCLCAIFQFLISPLLSHIVAYFLLWTFCLRQSQMESQYNMYVCMILHKIDLASLFSFRELESYDNTHPRYFVAEHDLWSMPHLTQFQLAIENVLSLSFE
jgi:hypothetical protein